MFPFSPASPFSCPWSTQTGHTHSSSHCRDCAPSFPTGGSAFPAPLSLEGGLSCLSCYLLSGTMTPQHFIFLKSFLLVGNYLAYQWVSLFYSALHTRGCNFHDSCIHMFLFPMCPQCLGQGLPYSRCNNIALT